MNPTESGSRPQCSPQLVAQGIGWALTNIQFEWNNIYGGDSPPKTADSDIGDQPRHDNGPNEPGDSEHVVGHSAFAYSSIAFPRKRTRANENQEHSLVRGVLRERTIKLARNPV